MMMMKKNSMNSSSKAMSISISSPGRLDKFPPPLMRFLKSNGASKSRRSRSSPMFMRSKKQIETTQEPSSPKVTCIGQVKSRRKIKKPNREASKKQQQRCWWVKKILFCHRPRSIHSISSRPKSISCKLVMILGCGCRRIDRVGSGRQEEHENRVGSGENGSKIESLLQNHKDKDPQSSSSSSPPKYALLLTRCRSAPYRSSSLACKFWGSPLNSTDETEQPQTAETESENVLPQDFQEKLSSSPNCETRKSSEDEDGDEEEKEGIEKSVVHHPLLLTRCKSEPARTGESLLNPDAGYWRLRRFADPQ